MTRLNHMNVLSITGICIDAGIAPYIVLPYMANGNLLDWLKRERKRIVMDKEYNEDEVHIQCFLK